MNDNDRCGSYDPHGSQTVAVWMRVGSCERKWIIEDMHGCFQVETMIPLV